MMKLLIIEDKDGEVGVMFVPGLYDDVYALEQADRVFESARIDKEIIIPDITHRNVNQYELYKKAI